MTSGNGSGQLRRTVSVLRKEVVTVSASLSLSPSHLSPAVVGMQRLRTMLSVLVLHRTKEDISHKWPAKLLVVELSHEEQGVYDTLFFEARSHS